MHGGNTFYRSNIEFVEKKLQQHILWITDGIIQEFTLEKCRIFMKMLRDILVKVIVENKF